jgi:hypothetical protein
MTTPKLFGAFTAMACVMVTAIPLRASDPVGVYALIDKVVFEPNEANPTAVQQTDRELRHGQQRRRLRRRPEGVSVPHVHQGKGDDLQE